MAGYAAFYLRNGIILVEKLRVPGNFTGLGKFSAFIQYSFS
jgi:hypothetical protein